jgi:membrane protein implicated in regulation of membrane protease activity
VAEDFLWAILGLTLVIVELLSGTFYLLMLGLAAFGAALAAWLGQPKNTTAQMPSVDAGQPASFDSWVDQGARRARVRYRGTQWDALVEGEAMPEAGAPLYVIATHGNTLKVTDRRPA